MSEQNHSEKPKRIIVLGVEDPGHQAVFEALLDGSEVRFKPTASGALAEVARADLVAVNVDAHKDFIKDVTDRGYAGKIVVIASSRATMVKPFPVGSNKSVIPVSFREAPGKIAQLLGL